MAITKRKNAQLLFFLFLLGPVICLTLPSLIQITTDKAQDYHVKWSPDGKTLAFTSQRCGEPGIWLIPAEGGKAVKLETWLSGDHHISWSPDGSHITFDAGPEGPPNIYTIPSKGGNPKRLSSNQMPDFHPCWSPDGLSIAFASYRKDNVDIWVMPSEGGQSIQLTHHEATDHHPVWSPNGSKIAFSSNRKGNYDIWIISASGEEPLWARSGKQIFYRSPDGRQMWVADVQTEPSFSVRKPRFLFVKNRLGSGIPIRCYDISLDDQRFLMVRLEEREPRPLTEMVLIQNWFEQLKHLVPMGK